MMKKCYCARRMKEKRKELESRSKKSAKPSMPKPASSSSSTKPITAKPRSKEIPLADDSGGGANRQSVLTVGGPGKQAAFKR